ncbi:MAG: DUF6920 family protein [Bacteroidota bacterium]
MNIWGRFILWIILGVVIAVGLYVYYQRRQFRKAIQEYKSEVRTPNPGSNDQLEKIDREQGLDELPPIVASYLRKVLPDPIPPVRAAHIKQQGVINMGTTGDTASISWHEFTADHRAGLDPPGFIWDASVQMMPLMTARVMDRYHRGRGELRAKLWGAFTVADAAPSTELDQGELLRFLAEAPWYPMVLHPAWDWIHWEAENDQQAWAILRDGYHEVRMLYTFNEQKLVERVEAEARFREVNGSYQADPWSGRFSQYQTFEQIRIPTQGVVQWDLESGPYEYWKGTITDVTYRQ